MTPQDAQFLKELAKEGVASRGLIGDLKNKVETLKRDVSVWKRKYEKLQEQKEALRADYGKLKKQVKEYDVIKQNIDNILRQGKEPERKKGKERE